MTNSRSLRRGTASERALALAFLLLLALGFALALVYLFSTEILPQIRAGRGFVGGVAGTYHGISGETRLESVFRTTMGLTLREEDAERLRSWIREGAKPEGYPAIEPLIRAKCTLCHHAGGKQPLIRNYEDLRPWFQKTEGKPLQALAKSTHVHLLAIPLLLFALGSLFVRTRWPEGGKVFLVLLPFAGVIVDIAHWWITRSHPIGAWGIVLGGMTVSLGFAAQWLLCILDLLKPLPPETRASDHAMHDLAE